uniref:Cytochrome p450 alkane hydroxylase n=1 Tax=Colletotrichum fructicola (strain Nara gc5) TaxID=1213859 RepID=L2G4A0_COLFN
MGLVEVVLEYITVKSVIVFAVVAWWLWVAVKRFDESIRLRRLAPGTRGQSLNAHLPGGIDFVFKAVRGAMSHKNVDFWLDMLSKVKGWTGEKRILGLRIVFTAEPENIKAILATQFSDYGKGEPFHREWHEFLGDSIFTTDGDQWHASRQLIRPQFVKDRVSDLQCFEAHIQTLFKTIANGGALDGEDQVVNMDADGKVMDISELFFRYTLDVATDFLLGEDVKSLTTIKQEFAEAFNEVQRVQNILARAAKLKPFVPLFTFRAGLKLVAVLLAGRDTTASTLSWTIYELGRHPEVVRKLRAEIIEQVGLNREPTYADLKSMKYLQNVMNETLRLYPVVPFNVRLALKDTTLPVGGGPDGTLPLAVCKDTPIGYSTLLMQRREDLYPPPWTYVPFNGGPRICIGQQFALTEMGYTLCRLFQRFERVESFMDEIDGGKPLLKAEIVLQPGDGVKVAFYKGKDE